MTGPRLTDVVRGLPASVPFVGPEALERARGAAFDARIGANENVFGPSPKAIEAMRAEAPESWKYGDPENHDLKRALAAHMGVAPANVAVGEGVDALLGYLVRLLIEPGDVVATSEGAYPTFNYHVTGYGGVLEKTPYLDDREDPAALFALAGRTGAKLVYLANPDNPMGTWHAGADIVAALEDLPEGCLLLLDEAYIELAPPEAVAEIAADDPRVIRMRSFSKAYGMAGARVGYAVGAPELIGGFDRIRNHFAVNRMAQAGALAALADAEWLAQTCGKVERARDEIVRIAAQSGLSCVPSATNFVAIDCGADGAFAKAVLDGILRRGVFVRMPFAAPQDRCIRLSCGGERELGLFAAALPGALEDARKG